MIHKNFISFAAGASCWNNHYDQNKYIPSTFSQPSDAWEVPALTQSHSKINFHIQMKNDSINNDRANVSDKKCFICSLDLHAKYSKLHLTCAILSADYNWNM